MGIGTSAPVGDYNAGFTQQEWNEFYRSRSGSHLDFVIPVCDKRQPGRPAPTGQDSR